MVERNVKKIAFLYANKRINNTLFGIYHEKPPNISWIILSANCGYSIDLHRCFGIMLVAKQQAEEGGHHAGSKADIRSL